MAREIDRAGIDPYDWRAVAPDGVVVALRVIELDQPADLSVWAHAVTIRMQEAGGYVLLVSGDVRSRDRTPGVELVFAHDESGTPFVYRVRLFMGAGRLYVLEAGGTKEQMERYRPSVDWMLGERADRVSAERCDPPGYSPHHASSAPRDRACIARTLSIVSASAGVLSSR